MIENLSKEELIGIARILLTAENKLMPEFKKALDSGKMFSIDEYCERIVNYALEVIKPLIQEDNEK